MDVLVLENERSAADSSVERLEESGHRVFRCHEPGAPVFPCRALSGDGRCPLVNPGIDVAVTVRSHPDIQPSPREDGVACALRARVPLVVAGNDIVSPYDEWAAEVVRDEDVVSACERVLAAPSGDHSEIATDALRDALQRRAGSTGNADALVWRDRKRLRVLLEGVEGVDDSVRGIVAADVVAALRAFDPVTPKIDISFS